MPEIKEGNTFDKSREHLANERTFLAWIRTSIALMGFGFVIVKFTLFLKEMALLMEARGVSSKGSTAMVGVIMVALGVIIAILAFLQYKSREKQLNNNAYASSSMLPGLITLIMIVGGTILAAYLLTTL